MSINTIIASNQMCAYSLHIWLHLTSWNLIHYMHFSGSISPEGGCFTNVKGGGGGGGASQTFRELSKIIALNIQRQKSHLLCAFQAETLYLGPNHGFERTYKVLSTSPIKHIFPENILGGARETLVQPHHHHHHPHPHHHLHLHPHPNLPPPP